MTDEERERLSGWYRGREHIGNSLTPPDGATTCYGGIFCDGELTGWQPPTPPPMREER